MNECGGNSTSVYTYKHTCACTYLVCVYTHIPNLYRHMADCSNYAWHLAEVALAVWHVCVCNHKLRWLCICFSAVVPPTPTSTEQATHSVAANSLPVCTSRSGTASCRLCATIRLLIQFCCMSQCICSFVCLFSKCVPTACACCDTCIGVCITCMYGVCVWCVCVYVCVLVLLWHTFVLLQLLVNSTTRPVGLA